MVVKADSPFNSWNESANIVQNKTFIHLSLNVNPNQGVKSCFVSLWEHEGLFPAWDVKVGSPALFL